MAALQVLHKSCWPTGKEKHNLRQHSKYTRCICPNSSLVSRGDFCGVERWHRVRGVIQLRGCLFSETEVLKSFF